jgi:hypothetical protein
MSQFSEAYRNRIESASAWWTSLLARLIVEVQTEDCSVYMHGESMHCTAALAAAGLLDGFFMHAEDMPDDAWQWCAALMQVGLTSPKQWLLNVPHREQFGLLCRLKMTAHAHSVNHFSY